MRAWTLLVIKTRQLLSERESQSAMIICRVWARWIFQFPVMFTNKKKRRSTSWLTMFNSFSFPTFLLFSPFRLVRSNTCVQWKHLTPERSIDLSLQTFPKLFFLLVPKVTTHSLCPECIANLKLPIDAFYRESFRQKRNITTELFGLSYRQHYWLFYARLDIVTLLFSYQRLLVQNTTPLESITLNVILWIIKKYYTHLMILWNSVQTSKEIRKY